MSFPISRDLAIQRVTDRNRWLNPEALDPAWNERARRAADYIPAGAKVLDLGCGLMALRSFLPAGCTYRPCDLVERNKDTIVCDFNAGQFPVYQASRADVITLLGVLEYIVDVPAFVGKLCRSSSTIVLSYHPAELTKNFDRASVGWFNNLSLDDIVELFGEGGYRVERHDRISEREVLIRAQAGDEQSKSPRKRIAVVSHNNLGNFGDRLGFHVVNSILPASALIEHVIFPNLSTVSPGHDLVILGTGNSLFAPLLTDNLSRLLDGAKAAVGIFGTQYREAIPAGRIERIIDRLDHWFARFEDDALIFGRGKKNVHHLGDWLITQFPMTTATLEQELAIGDEVWGELPLDRAIQQIQRHKRVSSKRLHPLLCAFTAAEMVKYTEQREWGGGQASGKFRSLLVDVFGRTFPENEWLTIDPGAVARYKSRVHANLAVVATTIREILRAA